MNKEVDYKVSGIVFDFKRFATGDGPGIRGLIFLKGCPLRCQWCSNPESWLQKSEIMHYENNCIHCGRCIDSCPQKAISKNDASIIVTNRTRCTGCGKCEEACLYEAREKMGIYKTVEELMEIIRRDKNFYDNSNGGITLTGGEPFLQCSFSREILKACKKENIHTAVETSGYTSWDCLSSVVPFIDLIFYDFKHLAVDKHKKFTGVSNKKIKNNLKKLNNLPYKKDLIIRIPYIPGFNDSESEQRNIFQYLSKFNIVSKVEVLPYHRLGSSKYKGLNRDYKLSDLEQVNGTELEYLIKIGEEYKLNVQIDSD